MYFTVSPCHMRRFNPECVPYKAFFLLQILSFVPKTICSCNFEKNLMKESSVLALSTLLYCIVFFLYHTLLYYTILYYTVVYCSVLYCTAVYCTVKWWPLIITSTSVQYFSISNMYSSHCTHMGCNSLDAYCV